MLRVTTQPQIEPITLDEAKAWLKVDFDAENGLIEGLIMAAREVAEHHTNRLFITQQLTEMFPAETTCLRLGSGNVQALVSVSVAGEDLEVEDYQLTETDLGHAVILTTAPATAPKVVYTAGYGDTADDVPAVIKQAMQLMITDWYENRADKVKRLPTASENLLNKVRRWVT